MASIPQKWFDTYVSSRGPELRASSRRVYGAWWNKYSHFLEEKGLAVQSVATSQVQAFLDRYHGNTAIRYYRLLLAIYECAVDHDLCTANPLADLRSAYELEEVSVNVTTAPLDALERLYSIKPGPTWKKKRDRALVLFAAETGLRRRELLDVALTHLHLDAVPPRVSVPSPARLRHLDLSLRLTEELQAWLAVRKASGLAGGLVFPASVAGEPLNPSTVYRIIERHLDLVGVGKETMGTSGARVLRATVAQRQHEQGVALGELQTTLGHRQLMSTAELVARLQPFSKAEPPEQT